MATLNHQILSSVPNLDTRNYTCSVSLSRCHAHFIVILLYPDSDDEWWLIYLLDGIIF